MVHDELSRLLPADVELVPYARTLDVMVRPTVLVRLDRIVPADSSGLDASARRRQYSGALLVVAHRLDVDLALSNAVDELAEAVLFAVDQSPLLTWSVCERVVVDEQYPGWEVQFKPGITTHQEGTNP